MKFMKQLEKQTNIAKTENGALGHKTTYNTLVDFNFKVPSLRKKANLSVEVKDLINSIEDMEVLYRYLFFLRDARGGMGERRLFREIFRELAMMKREEVVYLLPLVAEYGRFDDVFVLKGTPYEQNMLNFIALQLSIDTMRMAQGESISLLAKWLPSNNASNAETKKLARYFTNFLKITPKQYRTLLSALRRYLKVTEAQISREEFAEIDYASVPSYANIRYSNLFLERDYERRVKYLSSLSKGEVKINASVLYPQDVIAKMETDTKVAEGLWKNLRDFGEVKNTLVVVDVSGSMEVRISGNVTAMDASIGLGMYFAERNTGEFKDKVVTFSKDPVYVDLSKLKSPYRRYEKIKNSQWSMNTNLEKVFELVLDTAINSNCKQEEIPQILIVSDMEFDSACGRTYYEGVPKTLFSTMSKRFAEVGYELPRLVFWNVASRSNAIPLTENDRGVALVSGYSPASIRAVMSSKLSPYEALMDCIFVERYDEVVKTIKECA